MPEPIILSFDSVEVKLLILLLIDYNNKSLFDEIRIQNQIIFYMAGGKSTFATICI